MCFLVVEAQNECEAKMAADHMRLDRALTLFLFRPLGCVCGSRRQRYLPILMYHSISDDPENGVPAYYRTCTSPAVFAQHLELLRAGGCRVVSLSRGLEWLRDRQAGPENVLALTFDDGFRDFYTTAAPLLREHGSGATMFLPTAFIGTRPKIFQGRECMTWNEVRELRNVGIEFGSHTVNHLKLYELEFPRVRAEIEQSKTVIEDALGEPICTFAYPYAFPSADRQFVGAFVDLLKGAGYKCGVTTTIGRVVPDPRPYTLKRLPVNSADDESLFLAKLGGAYDWMALPQNALKAWKGFVSTGRRGCIATALPGTTNPSE